MSVLLLERLKNGDQKENAMRKRIIYECGVCGRISENKDDIRKCEAGHLNVAPETVDRWVELIKINMNAIAAVHHGPVNTSAEHNSELDERWKKRAERTQCELSEFEMQYGLKGKKIPENWEEYRE